MFWVTFIQKYAKDRHNHFWWIRWERKDLYGHLLKWKEEMKKKNCKKKLFCRAILHHFWLKNSNLRPLLTLFPQEFWISKMFVHRNLAKKCLNGVKKWQNPCDRQTNRQTNKQTDISIIKKHLHRGLMLWKPKRVWSPLADPPPLPGMIMITDLMGFFFFAFP